MATDADRLPLDPGEEYVSLEYDYYDLQKPTKTPPSFDVTEEEPVTGPAERDAENVARVARKESVPRAGLNSCDGERGAVTAEERDIPRAELNAHDREKVAFPAERRTVDEKFVVVGEGGEDAIVEEDDVEDSNFDVEGSTNFDEDDDELDILNLESLSTSAASEALEEVLNADPCIVETEFLRGRKGKRGVRVKFQDLSKPYVSRMVREEGDYSKYLHIVRGNL